MCAGSGSGSFCTHSNNDEDDMGNRVEDIYAAMNDDGKHIHTHHHRQRQRGLPAQRTTWEMVTLSRISFLTSIERRRVRVSWPTDLSRPEEGWLNRKPYLLVDWARESRAAKRDPACGRRRRGSNHVNGGRVTGHERVCGWTVVGWLVGWLVRGPGLGGCSCSLCLALETSTLLLLMMPMLMLVGRERCVVVPPLTPLTTTGSRQRFDVCVLLLYTHTQSQCCLSHCILVPLHHRHHHQ